jgi:demethylmenaquinone methyltransferase/2-methoxy-6-polyprenyl-1,4-benzoquinol methylase
MFDDIAKRYDFLNHLLSLGQDYYWRRVMTRELAVKPGERILDLAAGTGDSSRGFLRQGATVVGLDLSQNMLAIAKTKLAGMPFTAVQGSAYDMPFPDAAFDGLTCAFGIRNMPETAQALGEIYRVLKPGGRIVILEFSMPTGGFRPIYRLYLKTIIPAVSCFLSDRSAYEYLGDSIEKFYSPAAFRTLLEDGGFTSIRQIPLSLGTVYAHYAQKPTISESNNIHGEVQ